MHKQKPIIFSTEMVQAILDGRKSETRRPIKGKKSDAGFKIVTFPDGMKWPIGMNEEEATNDYLRCPYGKPGDLLYVKESFMPVGWDDDGHEWTFKFKDESTINVCKIFQNDDDGQKQLEYYRKITEFLHDEGCPMTDKEHFHGGMARQLMPFTSPRFMPKNVARIWLKVEDIQVEKLQDITDEGIINEGINSAYLPNNSFLRRVAFSSLWTSIHGAGEWEQNPWVWCVKFSVVSVNGKPENV